MTESVTLRIYIMFMCINMVLVFAGFSIDSPASDIMGATYESGEVADSGGILASGGFSGFITMILPLIDFFFGGGITGLLVAGGLPYEIRMLVGAPFFAMGVILLASLVKSLIPLVK